MQQIEALVNALPSGLFNGSPTEGSTSAHGAPPSIGPTPGVPPPSLSARTLVNPGRHFMSSSSSSTRPVSWNVTDANGSGVNSNALPLASSYLYLDDQGSTRWQGEMSGFPLLDLLLEHDTSTSHHHQSDSSESASPSVAVMTYEEPMSPAPSDWFPDRQSIKDVIRPEDVWTMISTVIAPDLMDRLVPL